MSYDVAAVRKRFPALAEGTAYFDGPGGTQVPDAVIEAITAPLRDGVSNRATVTAAERRAEDVVHAARSAMADLLGAEPGGVVFGRSMTQLTYDFARTIAKQWSPGDEIVLSSLDHDANFRPWVQAAESSGVRVRVAEFTVGTGVLPTEAVTGLLGPRTRLVAVTGASNLLGSRPDIPAITAAARESGALSYVDGVHLTPHARIDLRALGADFYACSPYKFLGPHLGALAADPALLETLRPDKLLPASDAVPERFEFGTLPYELLAGTTAAVDFLSGLDSTATGERRTRLLASMTALGAHEDALARRLEDGLRAQGVRCHGDPDRDRTPTVLFEVDGVPAERVYTELAGRGVNAPSGSFYAYEPARRLGLGEQGAVRAGIAPYTDESDVDRLLDGIAALRS
ncbi:cysteine desulfurase-like protein [Sciscionella sediminilitoris]|uniref:cysteine desulfurase-like protein n=1 Tax=Sciscionella sediminilitoris TaxID=1445613 RepID=UPI0004DED843|nr:cysteine desulfurase-like protein [Sciscionella sp. SE31]